MEQFYHILHVVHNIESPLHDIRIEADQDPPVMIACVRDPVSQTVSWWRYENNAIKWCVLLYHNFLFDYNVLMSFA